MTWNRVLLFKGNYADVNNDLKVMCFFYRNLKFMLTYCHQERKKKEREKKMLETK